MALQKDLPAPGGFTTSYHRIGNMTVDRIGMKTAIRVDSYKDQDQRKADPTSFVASRDFTVDGVPPGNPSPADACEWGYDQVVAVEGGDFADAEKI